MIDAQSLASRGPPPWFFTGPGQNDVLLIVMGVFLVLFILMFGVLMLRLHHLPEHIAQKEKRRSNISLWRHWGFSRCSATKTSSGSPGYC